MNTLVRRLAAALVALNVAVVLPGPTFAQGAASRNAARPAAPVSIQIATARGAASAVFEGTGASSGAAVRLKVKRNPGAPNPLTVTVPPGTLLRSSNPGAQSMMVGGLLGVDLGNGMYRPTSQLVLRGAEEVTALLSAFCAEFEKDNPSSSTSFALEAPDPLLACIAREGAGLPVAAEQAAVWMVTDRVTYSHMTEKFDVSQTEWASAMAVVRRCSGR